MESEALLFVYGTLRRGSAHPWAATLARSANWLGEGRLAGRLYDLGEYPGAVDAGDGWVRGDVYHLLNPAGLLPLLDDYEDFRADAPQLGEFRRVSRPVLLDGGESRMCWVYLYNRDVTGLTPVRDGRYPLDAATSGSAPPVARPTRV
jgi:gamma-glutamylcyclotransferase (GGCT)/AIG2-like uncharacterized protein YtfP